jgi:PKD repeat protein
MPETPQIRKRRKFKKKRVAVALILVAVVILLAVGWYFLHIVPGPGSLMHFFESKATAATSVSLSGGRDPVNLLMNKPLVADFSSAPEGQYSPLTIRFLDQSRGVPESWEWDFGDNTSSSLQHPVHQYALSGVYNVSLTVTRSDGSKRTVIRSDILGAEQPPSHKVLIDTLREGQISKGSEVSFISADANSSVIIDGKSYPLAEGSVVKMRTGSDVGGSMNIRAGRLVSFAFPDVTLFVNGTQVAHGESGDCNLPSYHYFQVNLTYAVRPTKGDVRQIVVDGNRIRAGFENSQILITYHSGAFGEDLTLNSNPAYFEGTATSFTISDTVVASFEPGPGFTGPAPLTVSFRDTSAGSPGKWLWDFGDQSQSDEQNPSHVYSIPGAYTVTLTASKGDQKDTIIRKTAVIASPPRVIANFTATPLSGPAPLTVRFTDESINAPSSWVWTFGPISVPLNSSEQNPVVIYTDPGTYPVSLTSGNVYGSNDITCPDYITVTEPFRIPDKSILVKTGKRGYIEKDSVMEFLVQNSLASISINGGNRELKQGSVVRLVAMSNQQGEIYIDRNEILKFSFPDMALYVNGDLVAVGAIDSIYVPSYSDFKTTLSYYLVPDSAYTYIAISGYDVLGDFDNAWIRISNLGMNAGGSLSLTSSSNSTLIDGAMNETVHDWVIKT